MSKIFKDENAINSVNVMQAEVCAQYHDTINNLLEAIHNRIKVNPNAAYYHRDTMMSQTEVAVLDYLFSNAIMILDRNISYCIRKEFPNFDNYSSFAISYIDVVEYRDEIHVEVTDEKGESGTLTVSSDILTDANFISSVEKEELEEKMQEHEEFKRLLKKYNYSNEELEILKNE